MHGAYDVLIALHAASAVIGFGAVAVSGAYGALGRKDGNSAEVRRFFAAPIRAEYAIVVVPFLGAAAMGVRPGGSEFGATWVVAGFVIWMVASVLLFGVVRPAEAAVRADRPGAARIMWAAGACDILFVIALYLMVTQPG